MINFLICMMQDCVKLYILLIFFVDVRCITSFLLGCDISYYLLLYYKFYIFNITAD